MRPNYGKEETFSFLSKTQKMQDLNQEMKMRILSNANIFQTSTQKSLKYKKVNWASNVYAKLIFATM